MDESKKKELLVKKERLRQKLSHQEQIGYINNLIRKLERNNEKYKIIWKEDSNSHPDFQWFKNAFPITGGSVDWKKIDKFTDTKWNDYSELPSRLTEIIKKEKLGNPKVLVAISDGNAPDFELFLDVVVKEAEDLFQVSWDTWVICKNEGWIIECFHHGKLRFSRVTAV